ncbi:NUDIX hydrolase [Phenylobacterium montanum]|nr:NUDIX hydrolase [Caulobacter sp. S6]
MKPFKVTGIQYAALPYRLEGRRVEVMLITSRDTGRWVIPKGWPMGGLSPQEAAAVEAAEEAGLIGEIAQRPIGSYHYLKRLKKEQSKSIQVIVFPFRVEERVEDFKEQGERTARWFPYKEAAGLVAEPSLRRLIRDFGAVQAANPIVRTLRNYWAWRFGAYA